MEFTTINTDRYTRRTHVIDASLPKPGDLSIRRGLPSRLKLAVHEYDIIDAEASGYTVILTHGTSFNKYFWQLVIDYLLSKPGVKDDVKRFIAIDAANHGDSAVLNRNILPDNACWPDDSRDILQTLQFFNAQQPVIGIGHSFGGGAMCHAAMMKPDAFATTILIEPILFQMKEQTKMVAAKTLRRRDRWESKAALTVAFERAFSDWDKRQLQVFLEQGVIPIADSVASSAWALKTPKEQEAATYLAAPHPQILDLLEHSKRVHHFIWGSESTAISAENRQLVERFVSPPSTTQVLGGAGHLIPMTHPESLSSTIAGILQATAAEIQAEIPPRFRL